MAGGCLNFTVLPRCQSFVTLLPDVFSGGFDGSLSFFGRHGLDCGCDVQLDSLTDSFTSRGLECHHGFPVGFCCLLAFLFGILQNIAKDGLGNFSGNWNLQLEVELFQKLRQGPGILERLQEALPFFASFGDDLAKVRQVFQRWTLGFLCFDQWRGAAGFVGADDPKCSKQAENWRCWDDLDGFRAGSLWRRFSAFSAQTIAVIAPDVFFTLSLVKRKNTMSVGNYGQILCELLPLFLKIGLICQRFPFTLTCSILFCLCALSVCFLLC